MSSSGQFQDLRSENLQLNEILGKIYWGIEGPDYTGTAQNTGTSDKYDNNESSIFLPDLMRGDESTQKTQFLNFLKTNSKSSTPIQLVNPVLVKTQVNSDEVLYQQRDIALSQSLFSAVLSLFVGMIIWEAEDPCMPLVLALIAVVGMSLKSVVEFFSVIKNKPASDAVALLSFNWFILGMLAHPVLPRVARMLAPLCIRLVERVVSWLGPSFV